MPASSPIDRCFAKPVIPVLWKVPANSKCLSKARAVILQGGPITELPGIVDQFKQPALRKIQLLVHIDLVSGLENSGAGLEFLAEFRRISGVVTIHQHLPKLARRLGLLSIVRVFLTDSRAVERSLSVAKKSCPDAIEIMPAVVATKIHSDFRECSFPRIAGGLCRTEDDVREVLASGCQAVTSTQSSLWELNAKQDHAIVGGRTE